MEKFRVRPCYKSKELLIEFWGEHRDIKFPDIEAILAQGLKAKQTEHPSLETASIAIATDQFISFWQYENGEYELNDDTWALFIHAPVNNAQVIADIKQVLISSGQFFKEEVDFDEYR